MFILLLAACGRTPAPVEETEGSADAGVVYEMGEAQLARHSGRPHLRRYFHDADGDSFGAPGSGLWATRQPVGYVRLAGDCDDADATVYPGNGCPGRDTGDTATDTGSGGTDTSTVDTDDSASTDTDSGTATDDTAVVDTATDTGTAVSGIVITRDSSGGLTYPATIWAWYGSGGSASASVSSSSDTLVFSPSTADLSDHAWIDIQGTWDGGADWSDDCGGFTVSSSDYTVTLYEKTVGGSSSDTCRIYTNLAVPSGGDVGVWTAVP